MPLVYRFIETFFVNDDRRALYIRHFHLLVALRCIRYSVQDFESLRNIFHQQGLTYVYAITT